MKLNDIKIGVRLALGFGLMLAMLAGITAIAVLSSTQTRATLNETVSSSKVKTSVVAAMRQNLFRQGLTARNIGTLTDVAEMEKEMAKIGTEQAAYVENRTRLSALRLTPAEQTLMTQMAQLEAGVAPLVQQAAQLVSAFNARQAAQVLTVQAAPLQEQWLDAIDKLVELQNRQIEENLAAFEAASDRGIQLMLAVSALSMLLAAAVAWLLTRSITAPLRDAVRLAQRVAGGDLVVDIGTTTRDETGQLLSALREMNQSLSRIVGEVRSGTDTTGIAAREIAAGNADLSSRTEAQASALEQINASISELTTIVAKNADNAQQANRLTAAASGIAVQGGEVVGQVVEKMGAIREGSRRIADIIGVIDGIAFQTNILALNAAVEAARAGEQGRGFAVVASEVRNLAQRVVAAAKEIKELIGASVEQVDAGSTLVDRAGRTMQEVVDSVKQVAGIMEDITVASDEQSRGIAEVRQAIVAMDEMTQQNAALVEQAAAAAQSMQQQAEHLLSTMGAFRTVGGEAQPLAVTQALHATLPAESTRHLPSSAGPAGSTKRLR